MTDGSAVLPGLPAVCGKPVHVAFDGGRLTSDAGILLLHAVCDGIDALLLGDTL